MSRLTAQSSLREFIDQCPHAAQMLMQLGCDTHQCADQSLARYCTDHGVDRDALLALLLNADPSRPEPVNVDWAGQPLPRLLNHILESHHEYLRRQLPRLQLLIDKACQQDGGRLPRVCQIREAFKVLRVELEEHLVAEEEILFPLIRSVNDVRNNGGTLMGTIDRAVSQMDHNFDEAAGGLRKLRALTDNFHPGDDACPAYQSFIEETSNLESDLERHAYLENQILFPRAIALERELMKR